MLETLDLVLLGQPHAADVDELKPETSRHSGKELRRVTTSFGVAAEESEALSAELASARDPENAIVSADGSRWRVANTSYSYQDGARVHRHSVELIEAEALDCAHLELLGVTLEPSRYKEAFSGDSLMISARVEVNSETDAALEGELANRGGDYFDVVRTGISDTPIRMRFGRCFWQRSDHGRIHLLHLVSEAGDEDRFLGFNEPEISHLQRKATRLEAAMDGLLEELTSSGVLSEAAVDAIRTRMDGAWRTRHREFDETPDVDRFF